MTDTEPGAHPLTRHVHAVAAAHHRTREHHHHVAKDAHSAVETARADADERHHARHTDGTDQEGHDDAGA